MLATANVLTNGSDNSLQNVTRGAGAAGDGRVLVTQGMNIILECVKTSFTMPHSTWLFAGRTVKTPKHGWDEVILWLTIEMRPD